MGASASGTGQSPAHSTAGGSGVANGSGSAAGANGGGGGSASAAHRGVQRSISATSSKPRRGSTGAELILAMNGQQQGQQQQAATQQHAGPQQQQHIPLPVNAQPQLRANQTNFLAVIGGAGGAGGPLPASLQTKVDRRQSQFVQADALPPVDGPHFGGKGWVLWRLLRESFLFFNAVREKESSDSQILRFS